MIRRAPREPTRDFRPSHRLRDDAESHALSLGCATCPDFGACGGMHTGAAILDCDDLCSCADRDLCDTACRNKPDAFVARVQEVGGFDLITTPRFPALAVAGLPAVVPLIGHKYSRRERLDEPVVAVPLHELFHMGTGRPPVRTRADLAERFRIRESATHANEQLRVSAHLPWQRRCS